MMVFFLYNISMKINMTKSDAEKLMQLVNNNNCELGRKIEAAYYSKKLSEGRELWCKLYDATIGEAR